MRRGLLFLCVALLTGVTTTTLPAQDLFRWTFDENASGLASLTEAGGGPAFPDVFSTNPDTDPVGNDGGFTLNASNGVSFLSQSLSISPALTDANSEKLRLRVSIGEYDLSDTSEPTNFRFELKDGNATVISLRLYRNTASTAQVITQADLISPGGVFTERINNIPLTGDSFIFGMDLNLTDDTYTIWIQAPGFVTASGSLSNRDPASISTAFRSGADHSAGPTRWHWMRSH